jgi:ABC-type transport system involved in multi-copper enzyme maturation permease subunit
MAILTAITVMVLAQGAIIGERRSGTVSWVLSSPVSRGAFVLSKLVSLAMGGIVLMVLLPGLLMYLELPLLTRDGSSLQAMPLMAALGAIALHLVFFLAFTIMLDTMFDSRASVIGATLTLIVVGGPLHDALPAEAINLTPWALARSVPASLARGDGLTSAVPLIVTALLTAACVALAIWRFRRDEY